jgi:hypothetical protein
VSPAPTLLRSRFAVPLPRRSPEHNPAVNRTCARSRGGRLLLRWATLQLLLANTVLATPTLHHSRMHGHDPRCASRVSARRSCLARRIPIGFTVGSFAPWRSISWHRGAPLVRLRLPQPGGRIRPWLPRSPSHTSTRAHTVSLLRTRAFGCWRAPVALRCAIVSLPHAPSRFVAQAPLHEASPNYSWCGRAGSRVPFLRIAAARRTARRSSP